MVTARTLLERYVEAKDSVRPELMRSIYRPDAVLTYTIDTDDIAFPARTEGVDAITRTLVTDFALRFAACKTYYVCAAPPADAQMLVRIAWLVIMREPAARSMRIGKGFYEWRFDANAAQGLINDVPGAQAQKREVGLPDPDVTLLRVDVAVGGLAFDPANLPEPGEPVRALYAAVRAFPSTASRARCT